MCILYVRRLVLGLDLDDVKSHAGHLDPHRAAGGLQEGQGKEEHLRGASVLIVRSGVLVRQGVIWHGPSGVGFLPATYFYILTYYIILHYRLHLHYVTEKSTPPPPLGRQRPTRDLT